MVSVRVFTMNAKTLTPKKSRFVEEFLIDLNATQAAVRAGYSKKTAKQQASRLLTNVDVAAAVAEAKRERSEAIEINAEWVLRQAVELHRRCMQEIKPARNPKTRQQMKDEDGNLLFTFNAAAANRALELIGKHVELGAWKERIEVSSGLSLVDRINRGRARSRLKHAQDAEAP